MVQMGTQMGCPSAFSDGGELHDVAPVVELHVVLSTDRNIGKGVILGVKTHGEGGKPLHAVGPAVVVHLDEVVGIAGFLLVPFRWAFPITMIFIFVFSFLFLICFLSPEAKKN